MKFSDSFELALGHRKSPIRLSISFPQSPFQKSSLLQRLPPGYRPSGVFPGVAARFAYRNPGLKDSTLRVVQNVLKSGGIKPNQTNLNLKPECQKLNMGWPKPDLAKGINGNPK